MRVVLAIFLFLIHSISSLASTIYVSPSGNDTNSGISWESAFKTINKAVNKSISGDTILVTNGTYIISKTILITNSITVKSINGANTTIIDGNYPSITNRVLFLQIQYYGQLPSVVDGFTIQNGYHKDPNPGVELKRLEGEWGARASGGGVRIDYGGIIRNCIVKNNYAEWTGGGVYLSHGGNIYNCTIVNNGAFKQGGGIHIYDVASGQVLNSIIYFNNASSNVNWGNNWWPIAFCCTTPEIPKTTAKNIFISPEFISSNNFRLKGTSLCINAGKNMTWMTNAIDMDSFPRIVDQIVDIGAYEYNSSKYTINILSQPVSLNVIAGNMASFNISAESYYPLYYQWKKNENDLPATKSAGLTIASVSPNDKGNYYCVISNSFISVTSLIASLNVLIPPEIIEQPLSTSVFENASVRFSIKANGSDPLNYQWKKNNKDINNARNAIYDISMVTTNDKGDYCCFVTNLAGIAWSLAANLRVLVITNIPAPPGPEPTFDGVRASDGIYCDKVRVTWGAVEGANKYQIWRGDDTNFHNAKLLDVIDGLIFEDKFTKHNQHGILDKYYYWVRAIGVPGSGTVLSSPDSGYQGDFIENYYFGSDYDNDGLTDWVVYTPYSGTIDIYFTASPYQKYIIDDLKGSNIISVLSDFNGDQKCDLLFYNPENYCWYAGMVNGQVIFWAVQFGWNGTLSVGGDFNGDKFSDFALYDTETYQWYIYNINAQKIIWGVEFGCEDGKPVVGDYNQDGIYDLIIKDSNGNLHIMEISGNILIP